jgi:hypothetical protein
MLTRWVQPVREQTPGASIPQDVFVEGYQPGCIGLAGFVASLPAPDKAL